MNTETCLATVLWMALLLGYLQVQAYPTTTPKSESCTNEIKFELLRNVSSCEGNSTFVYTHDVELECEANALETNINELNKIASHCKADRERIRQTMEQLKGLQKECTRVASSKLQSKRSDCTFDSRSHSTEKFFKYFKLFLEQLSEPI